MAEVTKQVPDVMERIEVFSKRHRELNAIRLNRATCELRYPGQAKNVSAEAWEASGGYVELPADIDPDYQGPSWGEEIAAVFSAVFEAAERPVVEILALVVVPDAELEEHDLADDTDEFIRTRAKKLLHQADLPQLFDLFSAALLMLKEQFAGKAEGLREGLSLLGVEISTSPSSEAEDRGASSPSPESSTDSPLATDGIVTPPSETAGETSLPSVSG